MNYSDLGGTKKGDFGANQENRVRDHSSITISQSMGGGSGKI